MQRLRHCSIELDIGIGNFEQGFPVLLTIGDKGKPAQVRFHGRLAAASEIPALYTHWQQTYLDWGGQQQWWRMHFPDQVTHVSFWDDCTHATKALQQALRQWFDQPELRDLREQILIAVQPQDRARLFIQTRDPLLRKLPWHLWPLLEQLPQLEISMSASAPPRYRKWHSPLKILAVLGHSQGLDLLVDQHLLSNLPGAEVTRLLEPTPQQLSDHLFEHAWDLLFFAGHSGSASNGETGYLLLNDQDTLAPSELKFALQRVVKNGLQLAILNSCDGLGLAQELADLHIPYLIVMREPVPDRIAQTFLNYFLKAFAKGEPFYLAVRQAREQLQSLERTYPCASWLPVICQHPQAPTLRYPRPRRQQKQVSQGFLAACGLLGILGGVGLGLFLLVQHGQTERELDLRISQGENLLTIGSVSSAKLAGIEAVRQGNLAEAVRHFEQARQQQQHDPETLIYLNNARIGAQPALTIAVSVPLGSNPDVAREILRGVAQAQTEFNQRHDHHRSGHLGHSPRLRVQIANDDNSPRWAVAIAHRWVGNRQIQAVIGHNASDASVAAAPIYQGGKLVMITPTSFADRLSSQGDYIFRMVLSIQFLTEELATQYIHTHPQARIALCSDSQAVDNESFRNRFSNNVDKLSLTYRQAAIVRVDCNFADPNFNPDQMVDKLLKARANTVLLAPHVDRIAKALALARANRGRLQLLASTTLYTRVTLKAGQDVQGLSLVSPWYPNMLPKHPFNPNARTLWGEDADITWRTAMSYDAAQIIGLIIRPTGSATTRQTLQAALSQVNFPGGATGTIQFTSSGERKIFAGFGALLQIQTTPRSRYGIDFIPLPRVDAPNKVDLHIQK
jgi:branched-chain amino acid transport system substrate-binding protein